MLLTFLGVLKQPQFYTYTFAGAFAFATLFIYVAGSPVIFMEVFHVTPQAYGGIFALLSVGFIGGSQFNIFLNKKFGSDRIFKVALCVQVVTSIVFFICIWNGWSGLYMTISMFFICLSCVGIINPNATALALAPFEKNIGSASALLGCTQIGVAALASSGVGLFNEASILPIVSLLAITSSISFIILIIGQRQLGKNIVLSNAEGNVINH